MLAFMSSIRVKRTVANRRSICAMMHSLDRCRRLRYRFILVACRFNAFISNQEILLFSQ